MAFLSYREERRKITWFKLFLSYRDERREVICGYFLLRQKRIGNGASRRKMSALAIKIDPTSLIYPSSIDRAQS